MLLIIILLIIIIIVLSSYLFIIKKELKRISKCISENKNRDSNTLIHQEISLKELAAVINEINELIQEVKKNEINNEQKNKKLKKMMINISHDLRTPLTSALGYIDIILNSNITREEKENKLRIIEERLKRLEELINSFFEFSKAVSEEELPKLSAMNIIALLEESIARYYEDYNNKGRKIEFSSSIRKYKLLSNKEMLIRIFDNLISNAYKHSDGDLKIEIENTKHLKIIFTNLLLHLDLDIDHIFDEFYTIDISRTKGNTGLGLAIVKEFTEQLGGNISAIKQKENLKIILEFYK